MQPIADLAWGRPGARRLVLPGLPERVAAGPAGLAWAVDDVLLTARPHAGGGWTATLWPLGGTALDLFPTARGFVALTASEAGEARAWWLPAGRSVALGPAWAARLGASLAVLRGTGERRLLRLPEGGPLPLPLGARANRLHPWRGDGGGVAWRDRGTVYRAAFDGDGSGAPRVRVAGSCAGSGRLSAGPHGALLAGDARGLQVAAPGRSLRRVTGLATEASARLPEHAWSADGRRLLLCAPGGRTVALAPGASPEVRPTAEGVAGRPAGWLPAEAFPEGARPADPSGPGSCRGADAAVVLDEAGGALRTLDGTALAEGFAEGAACAAGGLLYGPDGAARDLATGRVRWRHPALEADLIDARDGLVASVVGRRVTVLDAAGRERHRWRLPRALAEDLAGVVVDGDRLVLPTLDALDTGAATAMRLDGRPAGRAPWPPPDRGEPAPPPVFEGTASAAGRRWLWTPGGAVLSLPAA